MKIIVGLGNIGDRYKHTYHNLGFLAVELLAKRLGAEFNKKHCDATIALLEHNGERVLLAKPTTLMNRSGQAVDKLLKYYKCSDKDLIVLFDDIDIKKGEIRYREKGSSGTHNGMRDIVYYIGEDFKRIKIGAGRPENCQDLASYVLSIIPENDRALFMGVLEQAVDKVLEKLFS